MGHYVSYLNKWSPRSYNNLHLKIPNIVPSKGNHSVFRGDIFEALENQEFDLCYFDPPYGSNNEKMPPSRVRYASYYHIWTSIIKMINLNYLVKLIGELIQKIRFHAQYLKSSEKMLMEILLP